MTYQDPLTLFRLGMDTLEIASHLGCSEAFAYNEMHRLRQGERCPVRFAAFVPEMTRARPLVPYAGAE